MEDRKTLNDKVPSLFKKKATTSCWLFLFIYVEEKSISFSTVTYVTISLLHWYSQDGK